MKALSLVTLLFVGLLNLSKMEESPKILTIDSVGSEVMIYVGKAGFFVLQATHMRSLQVEFVVLLI